MPYTHRETIFRDNAPVYLFTLTRMIPVAEAEGAKEDDQVRREFVELSNKADGLVYSTARTLEEFADQVEEDERGPIQAALEDARAAMQTEDIEALRSAVDGLSSLTYKMTENLYAALGEDESEESD